MTRKQFIALILLGLCVLVATTSEAQPDHYPVEVLRVIDGDTIEVMVHVWPGDYKKTRIRVRGINAPELRTKRECEFAAAERARWFVEEWLAGARVEIRDVKPGKFAGRYIADVFVLDTSLAVVLVAKGLAVEYDGRGKRRAWKCAG